MDADDSEIDIESWNDVQFGRLRDFFRRVHDNGIEDPVVTFDRKLAKRNREGHEGLDRNKCNKWVYHQSNRALMDALAGENEKTINALADRIQLTTEYLFDEYPEDERTEKPEDAPEEDLWGDADFDWPEPEDDDPSRDREAEEWARIVESYTGKRNPEPPKPSSETGKDNGKDKDQEAQDWEAAKAAFLKKKSPAL